MILRKSGSKSYAGDCDAVSYNRIPDGNLRGQWFCCECGGVQPVCSANGEVYINKEGYKEGQSVRASESVYLFSCPSGNTGLALTNPLSVDLDHQVFGVPTEYAESRGFDCLWHLQIGPGVRARGLRPLYCGLLLVLSLAPSQSALVIVFGRCPVPVPHVYPSVEYRCVYNCNADIYGGRRNRVLGWLGERLGYGTDKGVRGWACEWVGGSAWFGLCHLPQS
jgi:hypothetical protein